MPSVGYPTGLPNPAFFCSVSVPLSTLVLKVLAQGQARQQDMASFVLKNPHWLLFPSMELPNSGQGFHPSCLSDLVSVALCLLLHISGAPSCSGSWVFSHILEFAHIVPFALNTLPLSAHLDEVLFLCQNRSQTPVPLHWLPKNSNLYFATAALFCFTELTASPWFQSHLSHLGHWQRTWIYLTPPTYWYLTTWASIRKWK